MATGWVECGFCYGTGKQREASFLVCDVCLGEGRLKITFNEEDFDGIVGEVPYDYIEKNFKTKDDENKEQGTTP